MNTFSNTDDVIDIRDVIARVEELRDERQLLQDELEQSEECVRFHHKGEIPEDGDYPELVEYRETKAAREDWDASEDAKELTALESLLSDLAGHGGDEQWEGDWYPVALVRDSYFTDYARELLEDCGDIPRNLPSYLEIDWDATARNIQVDYSSVEFGGVTYWYR